jgi:aryl-alcohol dehydrogenase-like predicted oxidoreductase
MEYRRLGNSGVEVSSFCLGTAFRSQEDESICIRVIDTALDMGCNFIDSALYGNGRSEEIVGKAIKQKRDQVFLCTKVSGTLGSGPNRSGFSRLNLMRGIEDSLRRLQTDHIDLYMLHYFDGNTPPEEQLEALDDIVRQGKAHYIGCSNFKAWKIMEALGISDGRNLMRFICIQNQYNLIQRAEVEPELMPLCREHGLGIMCYSPLAVGLLTGKFRRGQVPPEGTVWSRRKVGGLSPGRYDLEAAMTDRVDNIVQCLIDIGKRHDKTPAQVALAWILDHPEITAPILGPDLPEHVEDALGAEDWRLEPEDRKDLDEASAVDDLSRYHYLHNVNDES